MRVMLNLMGVMEIPKRNIRKRLFSPTGQRDPFTGSHLMTTSLSKRPAFLHQYYSTVINAFIIHLGIQLHLSGSRSSMREC